MAVDRASNDNSFIQVFAGLKCRTCHSCKPSCKVLQRGTLSSQLLRA